MKFFFPWVIFCKPKTLPKSRRHPPDQKSQKIANIFDQFKK